MSFDTSSHCCEWEGDRDVKYSDQINARCTVGHFLLHISPIYSIAF